ncbi:hypothetical protein [Idiomarina aminovorans]|uniref:hypothetical protein n=1 Tax=Idiomarina aminovorans TaxID=2914829 RepID=UPI002005F521|nr:hypothetical protein [Idiomarina sp. ATCH4]MCK7458023.1 hypothetical protein [Idiomarina sp. ATCH4]
MSFILSKCQHRASKSFTLNLVKRSFQLAIRSVVLARPHPDIVGDMAPFLKELGVTVEQVTCLSHVQQKITSTTDAVVVSLAVTSAVKASVDRVLGEVMRANPKVRLIFSSELPLRKKYKNLNYVLGRYFREVPDIMSVEDPITLNSETICLYICGNDLKNTKTREVLSQIIKTW